MDGSVDGKARKRTRPEEALNASGQEFNLSRDRGMYSGISAATGSDDNIDLSENKDGHMEKKRDREKKRRSEITNAVERLSQTMSKVEPRGIEVSAWSNEYANSPSLTSSLSHHASGASGRPLIGDPEQKNVKKPPLITGISSSSLNRQQQNRTNVIINACDLIERLHAENLQLKEQLKLFVVGGNSASGPNVTIGGPSSTNSNINSQGTSVLMARPIINDNPSGPVPSNPMESPPLPSHLPQQTSSFGTNHPIDRHSPTVLRNSLPFDHQQQEILHLQQLQHMQQERQLANSARQQSMLMQQQFSQGGMNPRRAPGGMHNVLGSGPYATMPSEPGGNVVNMILGGGRHLPAQHHQRTTGNMVGSENNLLLSSQLDQQLQRDQLSLQQFLLARSLQTPHGAQNASSAGPPGDSMYGGDFQHPRDGRPGDGGGNFPPPRG